MKSMMFKLTVWIMFKLIVCSPHGAPVSCKLNTKISFSPSTLTKWVKQIHSLYSVFPLSLSHFFSLCLTRSLFLLINQAGQPSATYSLQICGTGSPPFLIFDQFMMTHFAINQISHWTDVIWNASLFQTFFLIYFPWPFLRQNLQNSQFDNLFRSVTIILNTHSYT